MGRRRCPFAPDRSTTLVAGFSERLGSRRAAGTPGAQLRGEGDLDMSLAWMGRRVVRYLVACGLLAALVYALAKPEPPRVGYAKAIAGIPVNKTAPPLTGDLRLGGVLTCGPGVWDQPATFDRRSGCATARSSRARKPRPTPSPQADIGHALRCDVTATNSEGWGSADARSITYYPPAPTALTPPRVTGDLRLGRTLSCSRGTWNDDGVPAYPTTIAVDRATTSRSTARRPSTYTVTQADMGRYDRLPRVRRGPRHRYRQRASTPPPPRSASIPAVTGDLRLGGKLSCSRGVWDDEGITRLRHDQAVAARRRGDPRRDRRRLHRPPRRHRPLDRLPRPRGGPRRLAVEQRLPDQPVAALAAGHRGRPAARPHALLHARHVGRRRPHRRLRRRLRLVPPGHPRRLRPDVRRHRPRRRQAAALPGHGRRQDGGQQPDDLRPAAHEPDRPGDLRRRAPRPQRLSCSRGTWDDPATPYAVTYQWLRNGVVIDGATSATYAITADDVSRGALPAASPPAGFTNRTSAGTTVQPPEAFIAPRIEGDPRVGSTLPLHPRRLGRPGHPVRRHLRVVPRQHRDHRRHRGHLRRPAGDTSINCRVTAAGVTSQSPSIGHARPRPTGGTPINFIAPTISGDRRLGKTLTCRRGSWNDTAAAPLPGHVPLAPRRRHDPGTHGHLHDHRRRHQRLAQLRGHGEHADGRRQRQRHGLADPEVIVTPTISGDPRLRQIDELQPRRLARGRGDDRYAITYRWLRNGTAIPGATAATYTITTADLGHQRSTARPGPRASPRSQSPAVSVTAPRSVLSQVLSGQPRLRKTMSCGRGTWDDLAPTATPSPTSGCATASRSRTTDADHLRRPGDRHRPSRSPARRAPRRARQRNPVNGAETVRAPLNRIVPRLSGMPARPPARSAAGAVTGTTRRPTATASPTAGSAAPP